MPPPSIHVLLVSAQAAPNLLPALDPELKPKEVILLVTGKMTARAASLEGVFSEVAVKVTHVILNDEHDFSALEKTLLELATSREGEDIAGERRVLPRVAISAIQRVLDFLQVFIGNLGLHLFRL